jgi:hypothetical protein
MRTFTVTVHGDITPEDDMDGDEFAQYLLGEVRYRVDNETPFGLSVTIEES